MDGWMDDHPTELPVNCDIFEGLVHVRSNKPNHDLMDG